MKLIVEIPKRDYTNVKRFVEKNHIASAGDYYVSKGKELRWIPVSEKLPKEYKWVLCWYEYFRYGDYNRMEEAYGIGFYGDGRWGGDVTGHKSKVLAWMPLPEKYKAKKDGTK